MRPLPDLQEAAVIARAAIEDEPSRDLDIDEQETLAYAFLALSEVSDGPRLLAAVQAAGITVEDAVTLLAVTALNARTAALNARYREG